MGPGGLFMLVINGLLIRHVFLLANQLKNVLQPVACKPRQKITAPAELATSNEGGPSIEILIMADNCNVHQATPPKACCPDQAKDRPDLTLGQRTRLPNPQQQGWAIAELQEIIVERQEIKLCPYASEFLP